MGRLDLPDKQKDWVSVTESYLHELYDEIKELKAERERLRETNQHLEVRLRAAHLALAA